MTVLTAALVILVLLPVIYIIFDNLEKKFGKKFHKFSEVTSEKYEQFKEDKIKSEFRKIFNLNQVSLDIGTILQFG